MPYTPPSQQSPAASNHVTPSLSRSNSYVKSLDHPVPGVGYFIGPRTGPRSGLPRSASSTAYLNKERRSPTAPRQLHQQQLQNQEPSPDLTPVLERGNSDHGFKNPQQSGSLRQSPPPVNNNLIPPGAVMSPPDSTLNSSDDEESSRGRSRRLENLEELQAAISAIEQRKEGSPDRNVESARPKLSLEVTLPSPPPPAPTSILSPPLSKEQRKISHSRSNTESNIIDFPRGEMESPERSSDEDLEMARIDKPSMVRKKSGELVRPALRPASAKRRPSSMPGTPTYNKVVHFDHQLEHVRTFLQIDKPAAVSAGSSPVDPYDSEPEFPLESSTKREVPWEWEIKTPNFPSIPDRRHQPVMVEKIFLSADRKFLVGSVIVKNWAFNKWVATRFTLDHWKTTSEVAAEFSHDIRKEIEEGCDRFVFNIKLADQTNLEDKTLYFCVRYHVNGQEFWDSNGMMNFQVEFMKKNIPQKGKNGMLGGQSKSMVSLSSLPRSNKQRPMKLLNFDDFADIDAPFNLGSPPTAASLIGERPIKFRQKSIVPGSLGVQSKAAQVFGNRYDFGASLSATKTGSPTFTELKPTFAPGTKTEETPIKYESTRTNATGGEIHRPAALSSKPSQQSQSYNDLINKYCFVRSSNKLAGE